MALFSLVASGAPVTLGRIRYVAPGLSGARYGALLVAMAALVLHPPMVRAAVGWKAKESTQFCSAGGERGLVNVPGTRDAYDWMFARQVAGFTCLANPEDGHAEYVHLEAVQTDRVTSGCEATAVCNGTLTGRLDEVFDTIAVNGPGGRHYTVSLPAEGKDGYTYLSYDGEFSGPPGAWCSDDARPKLSLTVEGWTSATGEPAPKLDAAASEARFYVIQGVPVATVKVVFTPFQGDAAFKRFVVALDWTDVGELPACLDGEREYRWRWGSAVRSEAAGVHAVRAHTELKWPRSVVEADTPVLSITGVGAYFPPPSPPPSPPSPPPKVYYDKYLPTGSSLNFNEAVSIGVSLGSLGCVCVGVAIFYYNERRKRQLMEEEFLETMRFNPESFAASFMMPKQLEYHRDSEDNPQKSLTSGPGGDDDIELGSHAFRDAADDVRISSRALRSARHLKAEAGLEWDDEHELGTADSRGREDAHRLED